MALILNATIINGMAVTGRLEGPPVWEAGLNGEHLALSFDWPEYIWPWSGYLGIRVRVRESARSLHVSSDVALVCVRFSRRGGVGAGHGRGRRSRDDCVAAKAAQRSLAAYSCNVRAVSVVPRLTREWRRLRSFRRRRAPSGCCGTSTTTRATRPATIRGTRCSFVPLRDLLTDAFAVTIWRLLRIPLTGMRTTSTRIFVRSSALRANRASSWKCSASRGRASMPRTTERCWLSTRKRRGDS